MRDRRTDVCRDKHAPVHLKSNPSLCTRGSQLLRTLISPFCLQQRGKAACRTLNASGLARGRWRGAAPSRGGQTTWGFSVPGRGRQKRPFSALPLQPGGSGWPRGRETAARAVDRAKPEHRRAIPSQHRDAATLRPLSKPWRETETTPAELTLLWGSQSRWGLYPHPTHGETPRGN